MVEAPADTVSALPPRPRPFQTGRAAYAFVYGFAGLGAVFALGLAFLFPALLFRAEAERDARLLLASSAAVAWFGGFVAAAWVQAFPDRRSKARARRRAWQGRRVRARLRLASLLFVPFATYAAGAHVRGWLVERQDPLYGYCERGLCRALAQPGIAAPTSLDLVDGRLTLAVPAYPVRRARWWVDVDADDTAGRQCTFHQAVTFGDDPAVLHIPLPLESPDMPRRPFGLVPGSIVVVHSVRLTLDARAGAVPGQGPSRYVRKLTLVYEVPAPKGGGMRSVADFVSAGPAGRYW